MLQTAGEEELLLMASLVMNLNYGMVPFVPSLKVGKIEWVNGRKHAACFWNIIRTSHLWNWSMLLLERIRMRQSKQLWI